jgi:predicted lipoprotein with Yx(FWY)xxD motif
MRSVAGWVSALLVLGGLAAGSTAVAADSTSRAGTLVRAVYSGKVKATILVDAAGRTLYFYTDELPNRPGCWNDSTYHCSRDWPPLKTAGQPRAGKGVKASLLGTAKNPDGVVQVMYNHHALYYFQGCHDCTPRVAGDKRPGDLLGQGFYDIWFVVSPHGKPVKTPVKKP